MQMRNGQGPSIHRSSRNHLILLVFELGYFTFVKLCEHDMLSVREDLYTPAFKLTQVLRRK